MVESSGKWFSCRESVMRGIRKALVGSLLLGSATLCQDAPQYGTPFQGVPDPRDVNIYQVSIGQYSPTRNFQGVIDGLDRIKDLGINVIYLMPVYPVGESGSPYSISDFGGINPAFGTLGDLRRLVDGAHSRGMAVILDWIGYETAADHSWVTSRPEWYKRDGNGAIVKPFPDCAALNTSNSAVADTMIQYMRNWVLKANIDGFRVDWADYSEPEYWKKVIGNLRSISSHKLIFFAEGSNEGKTSGCNTCGNNEPGYHYEQGFDLIFGENFYWNFMKKVYVHGESAKNINGIDSGEYKGASSTQLVARYMSNHDEYGSDGSPYTWMGGKKPVLSAFVVATLMRGVPFIYNGVEVGDTSPLPYPWNTGTINWNQDLTVLAEMKRLLALRNGSEAIRRGEVTTYVTDNAVAFQKISGSQTAFVAVNVRNQSNTFALPAGVANATLYNGLTNASENLGGTLTLEPYQYAIYLNAVVHPESIVMSPAQASIEGSGTRQLSATVLPETATNKSVLYASSDTAVAAVSGSGLVTGVAPGTAIITARTADGAKVDSAVITVRARPRFTVYFSKPKAWGAGVKIYWWTAAPKGSFADGSWPGVGMTLADGWYSHMFVGADSVNLIFNDGTSQTADLSRGKTGWYVDGAWSDSKPGTAALGATDAGRADLMVRSIPGKGVIVTLPDARPYTVSLVTLSGKVLASGMAAGGEGKAIVLQPRAAAGGVVLVQAASRNGDTVTRKVVLR